MNTIRATNQDDQQYLEGLAASSSEAIQAVYDLALPSIILWVKANSGTEADARDIFQEALMALFKRLGKGDFELTCTLKSYLRIMCRNLWLTKIRDNKKWHQTSLDNIEAVELESEMDELMQKSAQSRLFYKHFEALGEKCKTILQGFFQKKPMAEIAKELDTSVGYIKKRKFICKEKLVEAVKADAAYKNLTEHST